MLNSVISYRFQYLIIMQLLVILRCPFQASTLLSANLSDPILFPIELLLKIWNTITGEVHKVLTSWSQVELCLFPCSAPDSEKSQTLTNTYICIIGLTVPSIHYLLVGENNCASYKQITLRFSNPKLLLINRSNKLFLHAWCIIYSTQLTIGSCLGVAWEIARKSQEIMGGY